MIGYLILGAALIILTIDYSFFSKYKKHLSPNFNKWAYNIGVLGASLYASIGILSAKSLIDFSFVSFIPVLVMLHYINQVYIFSQDAPFKNERKHYILISVLILISNALKDLVLISLISTVILCLMHRMRIIFKRRQYLIYTSVTCINFLLSWNNYIFYLSEEGYIYFWVFLIIGMFFIRRAELILSESHRNEMLLQMSDIQLSDPTNFKSSILDNLPVAVIVTDYKGNIIYANEHIKELTGFETREIIGKNPRIFKSGETPHELYREMWSTISKGNRWNGILKNRRKDNNLYWEQIQIIPVVSSKKRITYFVAIKSDTSEELVAKQELEYIANYDDLTGLLRRNKFMSIASSLQKNFAKSSLKLVVFDLDNFKLYNDKLGHTIGDEILVSVAASLRDVFESENSALCRLGGDEFVLLTADMNATQIEKSVIQIEKNLTHLFASKLQGMPSITISYGVSKIKHSVIESMNIADKRMYSMKNK